MESALNHSSRSKPRRRLKRDDSQKLCLVTLLFNFNYHPSISNCLVPHFLPRFPKSLTPLRSLSTAAQSNYGAKIDSIKDIAILSSLSDIRPILQQRTHNCLTSPIRGAVPYPSPSTLIGSIFEQQPDSRLSTEIRSDLQGKVIVSSISDIYY